MTTSQGTNREMLERISVAESTSEGDWVGMQHFLRSIGFPSARVVYGVVYLEGRGTMSAPPAGISSVARMILKASEQNNQEETWN